MDAVQQLVHPHHVRLGVVAFLWQAQAVNREWAKAESASLAVRVKGIVRSAFHSRFGDENCIARNLVLLDPILEIRPVDIGRVEIEARRRSAPDLQIIWMRSPAGIFAGPF